MVDPKFCNKVKYRVSKIYLKNSLGEVIDNKSVKIFEEIGQDTSLKDVIKQQQNKRNTHLVYMPKQTRR